MKTVVISEFKAKCIGLLKESRRTREPLLVTLRGQPIARVEPYGPGLAPRRLGALRGRMKIRGDIVHAEFGDDWETGR